MSVVLPTYNRVTTLPRAVSSVLAQTYRHIELLILDDGSTDSTAQYVKSVFDARVRYCRQNHAGVAVARNRGVHRAEGSLIAFQDSDDEWLPRKLELQVGALASSPDNVGWIGCSHVALSPPHAWLVVPKAVVNGYDHRQELLEGRAFVTPTWLVRRDLLFEAGLFDESFLNLEDWELLFRLDAICGFAALEQPLLIRHSSHDSLYGDIRTRTMAMEALLSKHHSRWAEFPNLLGAANRNLSHLYEHSGDGPAAVRKLLRAISEEPFRPRSYARLAFLLGQILRDGLARGPVAVQNTEGRT